MNDTLRLILTIGIFVIPPFVFGRLLINPKINRKLFASLSSLYVGLLFLLISIMYGQLKPIEIGVGLFLFILAFPGTFPVFYIFYPRLKDHAESLAKKSKGINSENKA